MNKMNKEEIENKIEEILNKNIVKGTAYTFGTERLKKELVALIQKSNKEAAKGFTEWFEDSDEASDFRAIDNVADANLTGAVETYLSSIGKEDKNE